jgi:hypothetical protein
MTKQQSKRPLINIEYKVVEPFVHATALGLAAGGPAAFSGNFWGGFVCGSSFSFIWYWGSNNLTRPKKSKPKTNVGAGSLIINGRKVSRGFEYAPYQPGYVSRETWGEVLRRLIRGKPEPRQRSIPTPLSAPREFVFQGFYEGEPVEIREDDLRRFLRAAWKYRQRGVGLGYRHWVRKWRQRPQWYKDLGPYWYKAVLALIGQAQQIRRKQLIVCIGPQWYALARDPHITLGILREAEAEKGNVQPITPYIPGTSELVIGTEGMSSFEG